MKSVTIVSAWGRGAYLAHQLRKKGFEVTVWDVTSLLPSLSSAEKEGPFGVFLPDHLTDLQRKCLCENSFYPVQQGFSVFTSQGPVEFRGPLKSFFMKTRKDFQSCHFPLSHSFPLSKTEKKTELNYKNVEDHSLQLFLIAAELTNSFIFSDKEKKKILLSAQKATSGKDISFLKLSPLFSEYVLRESSQRDAVELKESLCEEGVEWIDIFSTQKDKNASSINLKISKKNIQLQWNEQDKNSQFLIWTLSGPETKRCFYNEMSWLFPDWKEPVKIWRRFSLSWDQKGFEHIIPALLLVLPNSQNAQKNTEDFSLSSPKKSQVMSIKKHPEAAHADLWTLCPYGEHLNKSFLTDCLQLAMEQLRILFPGFSMEGILPDIEACHDYFILYESKDKFRTKWFKKKAPPNIFHLNPEATGKLDAYSLVQQSDLIFEKIVKLSG